MSPSADVSPAREGPLLHWQAAAPKRRVLLLHGFLDAAASWDLCAPHLAAAGCDVWALDLRGHGEGHRAHPRDYYHFPDYLLDVAEATAGFEEPFVLVGHSMGGMVSTMFAGTYPERVSHLVNIEGLGPPEGDTETTPSRMRAFVDGVRKVRTREAAEPMPHAEVVRRLQLAHPKLSRTLLESRVPHLTHAGEGDRYTWKYDPLHRTRGPFPFRVSVFERFAGRCAMPVLYVHGGPDGFRLADEAARLRAFPQLRTQEIAGAGHMVHWTEPEALARAIVEHAIR